MSLAWTDRPRKPHPSSCPCQRCENYDLGEAWEREEARYETRGEEPSDSRERDGDQAPDRA